MVSGRFRTCANSGKTPMRSTKPLSRQGCSLTDIPHAYTLSMISNYKISQVLFLSTKASLPPRKNSKYHFRLQGPIPIKRTTSSVEISSSLTANQGPRTKRTRKGYRNQRTINNQPNRTEGIRIPS